MNLVSHSDSSYSWTNVVHIISCTPQTLCATASGAWELPILTLDIWAINLWYTTASVVYLWYIWRQRSEASFYLPRIPNCWCLLTSNAGTTVWSMNRGLRNGTVVSYFHLHLFLINQIQTCPGFGWDRVNFLPSSWYSAVFWILCENTVDNTLMVLVAAT